MQPIKIFLASSAELKSDREQFEIFLNRKNKLWAKRGVFLHLEIWEDFLDAMSQTRLQDEYNKAIRSCDIFVMLFCTKVGKFTAEEFETAFGQFQATNKPRIYTYFKDAPISTGSVDLDGLISVRTFQEKLKQLGHFQTVYKNVEGLCGHFGEQLDKLADRGFFGLEPQSKTTRFLESNQEAQIQQANNLYDQVKAMKQDFSDPDQIKTQLIIEYAKDAIDLFGKTYQEKKVELRGIIDDLEKALSPDSIDSLKKRSEKALLRALYPRNPRLRNSLLIIIGLGIVASTIALFVLSISGSKGKNLTAENAETRQQPTSSSDEITIVLPDAATLLASSESHTVGKWLYTLVLAGKENDALQHARRIPDPIKRSEALAFIAQALSKVGKNSDASAIATLAVEAEDQVYKSGLGRLRPPALIPITSALIEVGRTSEAIEFSKRYYASNEAPWASYMIAKGLKCSGKKDEAKKITYEALGAVNKMKDPLIQSMALMEVIRLLASLRETENALKIAQRMADPVKQNQAFIALAKETYQLGDLDKVKQIIDEALDKGRKSGPTEARTQALAMISQTLVEMGENEKAKEIANETNNSMPLALDSGSRFTLLLMLCKTFDKIGRKNEANEFIDAAVSIAHLNDRLDLRTTNLIYAAKTLFRVGRTKEANLLLGDALNSAKQIPNDALRSSAILEIAKANAKFGRFQPALEITNFCSSSDHKLEAFIAITREFLIQNNLVQSKLFDKDDEEKDWPFELDFGCAPQTN